MSIYPIHSRPTFDLAHGIKVVAMCGILLGVATAPWVVYLVMVGGPVE